MFWYRHGPGLSGTISTAIGNLLIWTTIVVVVSVVVRALRRRHAAAAAPVGSRAGEGLIGTRRPTIVKTDISVATRPVTRLPGAARHRVAG